jgi:hypothetical protein
MAARDHQQRWDTLAQDMRRGNPPLHDPTKINIPMSASARIRQEPNTRDAINSRLWETHKYDPREATTEDIKNSINPIVNDMNPISSRTATQNYNQQAQFFPDPIRTSRKSANIAGPVDGPQMNPGLINNPFLQRLDPVNDARNIPREMRGAVNENNSEREMDAAKLLVERQFTSRFLPDDQSQQVATLKAYELLRPKTDDFSTNFRTV